jgi:hypothetical protein
MRSSKRTLRLSKLSTTKFNGNPQRLSDLIHINNNLRAIKVFEDEVAKQKVKEISLSDEQIAEYRRR